MSMQKPSVSKETICRLFTEIYESHVEDISELKSFDDQNFLIKYRTETGDSKCCIFKCVSGTDPDRVQHLQSQVEFMRFLTSKGFVCSQPISGKDGTVLYRKDLCKSTGKIICLFYAYIDSRYMITIGEL